MEISTRLNSGNPQHASQWKPQHAYTMEISTRLHSGNPNMRIQWKSQHGFTVETPTVPGWPIVWNHVEAQEKKNGLLYRTSHSRYHIREYGPRATPVERDTVRTVREATHVRVIIGVGHAAFPLGSYVVHEKVPAVARAETQQQHH